MKEQNDAAAPAAADETHTGTAAAAPAESNMFHHPNEPQPVPNPIPDPPHLVAGGSEADAGGQAASDVSEDEILDLRESALEGASDSAEAQAARSFGRVERFITLGEVVYYGDGSGQVWPAIIVHVYGHPADNDEDRNDTYVDLHVFKRKLVTDVEKISQHNADTGALNGWVFKA